MSNSNRSPIGLSSLLAALSGVLAGVHELHAAEETPPKEEQDARDALKLLDQREAFHAVQHLQEYLVNESAKMAKKALEEVKRLTATYPTLVAYQDAVVNGGEEYDPDHLFDILFGKGAFATTSEPSFDDAVEKLNEVFGSLLGHPMDETDVPIKSASGVSAAEKKALLSRKDAEARLKTKLREAGWNVLEFPDDGPNYGIVDDDESETAFGKALKAAMTRDQALPKFMFHAPGMDPKLKKEIEAELTEATKDAKTEGEVERIALKVLSKRGGHVFNTNKAGFDGFLNSRRPFVKKSDSESTGDFRDSSDALKTLLDHFEAKGGFGHN